MHDALLITPTQEVLVVANDSILCITSDGAQICGVAETPIVPNEATYRD